MLLRDRDYLLLKKREALADAPHKILHHEVREIDTGFEVPRDPKIACLDADKLKNL